MEYELIETQIFNEYLKISGITTKDYDNFKRDIAKSPKQAKGSHSLKGTLGGYRSAHIRGGQFIIIFLICEECFKHINHNDILKNCPEGIKNSCSEEKRIILLGCGNHGFYKTFERRKI